MYFEEFREVTDAIAREKQIKAALGNGRLR
jgi:hypothetical protein